jgi:hypothetical protein
VSRRGSTANLDDGSIGLEVLRVRFALEGEQRTVRDRALLLTRREDGRQEEEDGLAGEVTQSRC